MLLQCSTHSMSQFTACQMSTGIIIACVCVGTDLAYVSFPRVVRIIDLKLITEWQVV